MRIGTLRRVAAGAAILLALAAAAPVHAGWNPNGVTVTPTTASIPRVTACSDGAGGTFVAWQEEASPGSGVLRAQHLLATGDLDPAWPADGSIACSVVAARPDMGALPDRLGGLYLWWEEGSQLFVTRLDATGVTAAGWPARGRGLGSVFADSPRRSRTARTASTRRGRMARTRWRSTWAPTTRAPAAGPTRSAPSRPRATRRTRPTTRRSPWLPTAAPSRRGRASVR